MAELSLEEFSPAYQALRQARDNASWQDLVSQATRTRETDVSQLVERIAPQYGVDPRLVMAVMGLESGGNPTAVSRKGAQGAMQLMPGTAARFGVTNPLDPEQNITGGVRYLAFLRDQFPGRPDLQLAGYHAGEGAVRAAGNQIPNTHDGNMSTGDYVRAIMARYQGTGTTPQQAYVSKDPRQAPAPGGGGDFGPEAGPAPGGGGDIGPEAAPGSLWGALSPESQEDLGAMAPGLGTPQPQPQGAPPGPPLPSVEASRAAIAPGMVNPTERTLPQDGRERAYRPFTPQEGVEEAEPTRSLGWWGTQMTGWARGMLNMVPALSTWAQGQNQPGVVAGLATLADDLQAALRPVQKALTPTVMGEPNAWDKLMQGVGSVMGPLAVGGLTGGLGTGAVASAVTEAAGEGGQVREQLAPLVGEQEASRRAMHSFALNTALVYLTDKLGIFGEGKTLLSRVVSSIVTNGLQEAVQYDIERRQFWVPATHPEAKTLLAQGWEQQGDRVVKPFVAKDAGEVALLGAIVGVVASTGVGLALEQDAKRAAPGSPLEGLKTTLEQHPDFHVADAAQALKAPDTPPQGVEPSTWQRWQQTLLTLLPKAEGGGIGRQALGSERGAVGVQGITDAGTLRSARGRIDAAAQAGAGVIAHGQATDAQAFQQAMGERLADATPEEVAQVYSRAQEIFHEQVTAVGRNLPSMEHLLELAHAGKDVQDWYHEAMPELEAQFGEDARTVAAMIAATSPQVNVRRNLELAMMAYEQWKMGKEITLPGLKSSQENARRAARGEEISGPKINNFFRNITGDPGAVTIDVWMKRLMGFGPPEGGEQGAPTTTEYRFMEEWTKQLAAHNGVTPREMQAALWVGAKLMHGALPGERAADITKPLRDYVREAAEALRERRAAAEEPPPARPGAAAAVEPETGMRVEWGKKPPDFPAGMRVKWGEGGQADLDTLIPLATTMVGALAGCMRGEATGDCIEQALAGAGLGGALSFGAIRYLRRNLLNMKRMGALADQTTGGQRGGYLQRILSSERGALGSAEDLPGGPPGEGGQPAGPPPQEPPAEPPGPPLRVGAEGLPEERYRTPQGQWRIPLRDMPSQELELQDFIRQQGGIKVRDEELRGEFAPLLTRRETGTTGLHNDLRGLSAQQMAERAQEHGFIPTADKESLLRALDRSVTEGQPVHSVYAQGFVPALDDPHVRQAYQATLDALDAVEGKTAEQVGGVRHRKDVHAEAQALIDQGLWTLDDVRELMPNMTLNDTMASALVTSLHTLGQELSGAAQRFLDNGAKVGSREEQALQQTLALFAELDPHRLGVSAAHGRALGILNDPLSGYTRFLNELHDVLKTAPEQTMKRIAMKLTGAQARAEAGTPEGIRQAWELRDPAYYEQLRAGAVPEGAPQPEQQALLPGTDEQLPLLGREPEPGQIAELLARYRAEGQERQAQALEALLAEHGQRVEAMQARGATMQTPQPGAEQQPLLPLSGEELSLFGREAEPGQVADLVARYRAEGQERRAQQLQALWDQSQAFVARDQARAQEPVTLPELAPWHQPQGEAPLMDTGPPTVKPEVGPWTAPQDAQQVVRTAQQMAKPGLGQYWLEAYINALLSNPASLLANLGSNTAMTLWQIPQRWLASQLHKTGLFSGPGPVPAEGVAPGEASALWYGLTHALREGLAVTGRSAQSGQPEARMGGSEFQRPPVWTAENLGVDPDSSLGKALDMFFHYGLRGPSLGMMATDEGFQALNYLAELNALGHREATRQGLEGKAFADHAQTIAHSPRLADIQQAAQSRAVLNTFQQALQEGGLGQVGRAIQRLGGAVAPIGRTFLPFLQTPANIARETVESTPLPALGLVANKLLRHDAFFQGVAADMKAGGARAEIATAKMLLGTLLMLAAGGLAMDGRLTGRAPANPVLREAWLKQFQPYSVKPPGMKTWISLNRMDPHGALFGMVGDIVQLMGEKGVPMLDKLVSAPFYALMANITNKTYFKSASDFFDAMSSRPFDSQSKTADNIERYVRRQVGGMLQPSSGVAALARTLDPATLDARDIVDAVASRVPGWSSSVPAQRSLYGDPVIRGYGQGQDLMTNTLRAFNPWALNWDTAEPADKEILNNQMRLELPTRSLAGHAVAPGALADPQADLSGLEALHLDPRQYELYTVLAALNRQEARALGADVPEAALAQATRQVAAVAGEQPPAEAMDLRDALNWLVTTPGYLRESPGQGGGREKVVQTVVSLYRDVGRQLLLAQQPALAQQLEQTRLQQQMTRSREGDRGVVQERAPETMQQMQERVRALLGIGGP